MARTLSSKSSLDNLKKEAKRWLKQVRNRAPGARERLALVHPKGPHEPTLRDLQYALAREYGYSGWRELVSAQGDLALDQGTGDELASSLLDLACLTYGVKPGGRQWTGQYDNPERRERAARLLRRHPALSRHSIHTAVVCGDTASVESFLERDTKLAVQKGGPHGWEPLSFLAYGRLPIAAARDNAVAIARSLLDHGADPSAYWTYDAGGVMKWPVLVGVIGEGEAGMIAQPPHPAAEELARLLLERGADPNPSQALYNTMLHDDDTRWLELFIEYGLDARATIAWFEAPSSERMFQFLLGHAVERGQYKRTRLLLEHGADPTDRPYHERALRGGHAAIAALLLEHGATPSELRGAEELALELVELLLARGADPAHRDREGKAAEVRALERGLDAVADAIHLSIEQSRR